VVKVTAERPLRFDFPGGFRKELEDLFRQGFPREGATVGTGFLFSRGGLVLTNWRIVSGAKRVRVRFTTGPEHEAAVLGGDSFFQTAVLRAEPPGGVEPLELASGDPPPPGSLGVFVGNSFGISANISLGIVTATRRSLETEEYDNYLVMNAAVLPGDAGGPFLGPDGKVLGMGAQSTTGGTFQLVTGEAGGPFGVRQLSQSSGMGLVVPAGDLRFAVDEIAAHGRVRGGRLGIRARTDEPKVTQVLAGSPAEIAGLVAGDLIVSVARRPVLGDLTLRFALRRVPVGAPVEILVRRGEAEMSLRATLEEGTPAISALLPLLSFNEGGEVVVGPVDGRFQQAGIHPGDVCVSVNGVPVATPSDMMQALGQALEDPTVLLRLRRAGGEMDLRLPR
jgi:serine protease Do